MARLVYIKSVVLLQRNMYEGHLGHLSRVASLMFNIKHKNKPKFRNLNIYLQPYIQHSYITKQSRHCSLKEELPSTCIHFMTLKQKNKSGWNINCCVLQRNGMKTINTCIHFPKCLSWPIISYIQWLQHSIGIEFKFHIHEKDMVLCNHTLTLKDSRSISDI